MKFRIFRSVIAITGILALGAIGLSACAGKETKTAAVEQPPKSKPQAMAPKAVAPDKKEATPLGESVTEEGTAEVRIERSEEVPTIRTTQDKADINRMDRNDFVALGLPSDIANRVVQNRQERGAFDSIDQLAEIPGVTPGWVEQNRSRLAVG